MVLCWIW